VKLKTPLSEKGVRALRVGDALELSGTVVTARDTAHKYLAEGGQAPCDLNVIYHCGPIVKGDAVIAAGPTTSIREEPYEADVIGRFGVRAVIGKGGMGEKTLAAMRSRGCVYLAAVGGAGALMAERVKRILAVHKLREFGAPEAFWVLEVEDFPLVVAMDTAGDSIYRRVEEESAANLRGMLKGV
jgi:tartrate/fumarate subfamily iron-sulfur-dependent hydro-lyase beta chain